MPTTGRTPLGEWNGQYTTPLKSNTANKSQTTDRFAFRTPAAPSEPVLPPSLLAKYPFLNSVKAETAARKDRAAAATRAITLESRTHTTSLRIDDSTVSELSTIPLSDIETSELEEQNEVSYPTRYDRSSLPGLAGTLRQALRGPSRRPPPNSPATLFALPHRPRAASEADLPQPDRNAIQWVEELEARVAVAPHKNAAASDEEEEELPSLSFRDLNELNLTPFTRPTRYPLFSTPLRYGDSLSSIWSQPSAEPSHLRSSFIPASPDSPDSSCDNSHQTPSKIFLRHPSTPVAATAMDGLWEYESTSSSSSSTSSGQTSTFSSPLPQLHLSTSTSPFRSLKIQYDISDDTTPSDNSVWGADENLHNTSGSMRDIDGTYEDFESSSGSLIT